MEIIGEFLDHYIVRDCNTNSIIYRDKKNIVNLAVSMNNIAVNYYKLLTLLNIFHYKNSFGIYYSNFLSVESNCFINNRYHVADYSSFNFYLINRSIDKVELYDCCKLLKFDDLYNAYVKEYNYVSDCIILLEISGTHLNRQLDIWNIGCGVGIIYVNGLCYHGIIICQDMLFYLCNLIQNNRVYDFIMALFGGVRIDLIDKSGYIEFLV